MRFEVQDKPALPERARDSDGKRKKWEEPGGTRKKRVENG
jgi:hypothetical protein